MNKKELGWIRLRLINAYAQLFGSEKYGKFVIISRSRSGSNLLLTLLDSHPDIRTKGEIFNYLGNRSCHQLYNMMFPRKAVKKWRGCKLFYYHPLDSEDYSIWDTLERNEDVRIIHLIRKNMLRVYISRLIAGATSVWKRNNNKNGSEHIEVEVDISDMEKDFRRTKKYIEQVRTKFQNHHYLEVNYRDLVKHKEMTLERILNFLDLPKLELRSDLKKQNDRPIETLVSNYDELEEALRDSSYAHFLDHAGR